MFICYFEYLNLKKNFFGIQVKNQNFGSRGKQKKSVYSGSGPGAKNLVYLSPAPVP